MEINPRLFDKHGRLRLGRGYMTCTRWHPLFPEQPYLAVGLSSGEIVILRVEHSHEERRITMEAVQEFPPMPKGTPIDLDWGPGKGEDAGRHLAVAEGRGGVVRVLDVEGNREHGCFPIGVFVSNVAFSPDGKFLAGAGTNGCPVRVLRFSDGTVVHEVHSQAYGCPLSFSPDGGNLAVRSPFGILDISTGNWRALEPVGTTDDFCENLSFSPDGRYLLTTECEAETETYSFVLRHSQTGEVDRTAFGGKPLLDNVIADRFMAAKSVWGASPNQICYGVWNDETQIRTQTIRDVRNGERLAVVNLSGMRAQNDPVQVSPDATLLAYVTVPEGTGSAVLECISFADAAVSGCWEGVRCLQVTRFSPCGTWLCARSASGCHRFDLPNMRPTAMGNDSRGYALSPDGRLVGYGNRKGHRKSSEPNATSTDIVLEGYEDAVNSLAVSPDGRYAVPGNTDVRGTVTLRVNDLTTGKPIPGVAESLRTDKMGSKFMRLAIMPDGRHVACFSPYRTAMLSLVGRETLYWEDNAPAENPYVAISPDGTWCVRGSGDRLFVYDLSSGRKQASYDEKGVLSIISDIALSPCGRWLIAAGGGMALISTADWRTYVMLDERYQVNGVDHVAFSPDGRYLSLSGRCAASSTILDLERVLGAEWFAEYHAAPLIVTAVWFPKGSLDYLRESDQGNIVTVRPLARCGECGRFFPVDDTMLGKEVRCPNERQGQRCNRLLKLNPFVAGFQDPEVC